MPSISEGIFVEGLNALVLSDPLKVLQRENQTKSSKGSLD
jgi:hypothetical protein